MAELLGIISGGAGLLSLALQLGDSAAKLKRFYNSARNAPKTLEEISFDLDTMALALRQLEQYRQSSQSTTNELLARCIERCQRSTISITGLVEKLENFLKRHEILGKASLPFREKEIEKMLTELEQAKSSLSLTFQLYCHSSSVRNNEAQNQLIRSHGDVLSAHTAYLATLHSQDEHITKQIEIARTSQAIKDVPSTRFIPLNRPHQHDKFPKLKRKETRFRFSLPRWLSSRIWDVAFHNAEGLWAVNIRFFNVVDSKAPVIQCCRTGDIQGLCQLLDSRQAGFLDVDEHGNGLLHWALSRGNYDVCRFILQRFPSLGCARAGHPLQSVLVHRLSWMHDDAYPDLLDELLKFCIEEIRLEFCIEDPLNDHSPYPMDWWTVCTTTEAVELILKNQSRPYSMYSLEDRLTLADHGTGRSTVRWGSTKRDASWLLSTLGGNRLDQRITAARSRSGNTALHVAVRMLVQQNWQNVSLCELISDLLSLGAHPSAVNNAGLTPFMQIITALSARAILFGALHGYLDHVAMCVQQWAKLLRNNGFDLEQVGLAEAAAIRAVFDANISLKSPRQETSDFFWLYGLKTGPEPEDWAVEVGVVDQVPIFKLNEMPGTWPDPDVVPRQIAWYPNERECAEGDWVRRGTIHVRGASFLIRTMPTRWEDPYKELMDAVQDDTGALARMAMKHERCREVPRKRSQSHATLSGRKLFDYAIPATRIKGRKWLGDMMYHQSLTTSSRHLAPKCSGAIWWHDNLRDCIKGVCSPPDFVRDCAAADMYEKYPWKSDLSSAKVAFWRRAVERTGKFLF